jgi:type II secretory pathway component GspD/PulD (secretin)
MLLLIDLRDTVSAISFGNEAGKRKDGQGTMMRCMPGGSQRRCIVSILVIFSVLLPLNGYIIRPVWGAESEINESVFSLDVRDKPLSGVLRTINEQTGFNFSVTESAKNVPVTISLSKVPLLEGLNRVIKSTGISNHAVVFDNRKNISIIIMPMSNFASDGQGKPSESESIQNARADKFRLPSGKFPPYRDLELQHMVNNGQMTVEEMKLMSAEIAAYKAVQPPPPPI